MGQPFTDLLIRIRKGSRVTYPVEAWLGDGSFYQGDLRLTKALRQELLKKDYEPVTYGQLLFRSLFDGEIATAYDVATGLARQRSEGRLRLRLLLDEGAPVELHAIKWERLADLQGCPLGIDRHTPLSRYTALSRPEPKPLDEPVVRLLFVVSAPEDLAELNLYPIDVQEEVGRLLGALGDVWRNERCQVTILPGRSGLTPGLRADLEAAGCTIAGGNATLDNIGRCLRDQHALHFLGHGQYAAGHGYLLLENEAGTMERVEDTDLAARLANTLVRLVFLAACESARRDAGPAARAAPARAFQGLAGRLVQGGDIAAVVAMQEPIDVNSACKLAGEFYRRLFLDHGVVDRALNEARAVLYDRKDLDWGTPVLTMRLTAGQLAMANPVWTALRAIREHADYAIFRSGDYIPLPMQAILVDEGRDPGGYEEAGPQSIGTLDLMDAILGQLEPRGAGSGAAAAPLVLVLGGPSTGKSTQMKRLGWQTVQAGLEAPAGQFFLPLYLDLQEYRPGGSASTESLEKEILERLRLFLPGLAARSLEKLGREMPQLCLRLLLSAGDTVPEVGGDLVRLTVDLARDHPRHQYVVALQPSALHWQDLKEVDPARRCVLAMQPLTQRGIRHLLESRDAAGRPLPEAEVEAGRDLLQALHDASLFDLASTPFFLVKMIGWAQKKVMPTSRAEVLRQLMDEAIAQVPPDWGMRANAPRTLFRMALEMQRSGAGAWPIGEAFRTMSRLRGERGYEVEALYESLVRQELLAPVGEGEMRFAYSSIQAYCCARAMLDLPQSETDLCDLVDSLGSPERMRRWGETLVIACGLLARSERLEDRQALSRMLELAAYGADLLEGRRIFFAARCLLECTSVLGTEADREAQPALRQLVDHVGNALRWRSDSDTEPDLEQRLEATQLLAQLPVPGVAIGLAEKAYRKVRRKVTREWDYEFSSVRFAAAIALKRMDPARARAALNNICPHLHDLFLAWEGRDVEQLLRYSRDPDDPGLQGLAALALGDLHAPLRSAGHVEEAQQALVRLEEMFLGDGTDMSVRWPVADALSLLDSARVTREVVEPLLGGAGAAPGPSPRTPGEHKALAYLIGLLRLRSKRARHFLLRDCLGFDGGQGSRDWSVLATAVRALGRVAGEADTRFLAEIAAGRAAGGQALDTILTDSVERNYVRREAVNALANQGDLEVLSPEDGRRVAQDPALFEAYYRAIGEIYWRREAAACAGAAEPDSQGGRDHV